LGKMIERKISPTPDRAPSEKATRVKRLEEKRKVTKLALSPSAVTAKKSGLFLVEGNRRGQKTFERTESVRLASRLPVPKDAEQEKQHECQTLKKDIEGPLKCVQVLVAFLVAQAARKSKHLWQIK